MTTRTQKSAAKKRPVPQTEAIVNTLARSIAELREMIECLRIEQAAHSLTLRTRLTGITRAFGEMRRAGFDRLQSIDTHLDSLAGAISATSTYRGIESQKFLKELGEIRAISAGWDQVADSQAMLRDNQEAMAGGMKEVAVMISRLCDEAAFSTQQNERYEYVLKIYAEAVRAVLRERWEWHTEKAPFLRDGGR